MAVRSGKGIRHRCSGLAELIAMFVSVPSRSGVGTCFLMIHYPNMMLVAALQAVYNLLLRPRPVHLIPTVEA